MQLKKLKQNHFDSKIFWLTIVLLLAGLVLLFSASTVVSVERYGHNYYFVLRQALFVGIGIVGMLLMSRINYLFLKRYALIILALSIVTLLIVLIPGIGFKAGDAQRWISLGPFLFQPSEFAKLALIFYVASWFDSKEEVIKSFFHGVLPALAVTTLIFGLILLQPDFGSATAVVLIALSIFFSTGVRLTHLASIFIMGLGASWLAVTLAPYRLARIKAFLDPGADPLGIGYHINQALLAIGSGGLWGFGYGNSRQKHFFLPEPIGDSVFAISAEELGFVRIVSLLVLFLLFAIWGYRIANRAPDNFGKLVATGITTWVVLQAIFNIGAMVGLLPLTGIPLPFISYGGSSVIAVLLGVGVLLNISRNTSKV